MRFPRLPYSIKKNVRTIKGFGGLNKTENYKEGQLKNDLGLSSKNYPALVPASPLKKLEGYSDITDMYEHNGKILTVGADGKLVFDGQHLGNIKPGRKQFATVNTRLCIFPDKVYIDLNDMKLLELAEVVKQGEVVYGTSNRLDFAEDVSDILVSGDKVDISGTPASLFDQSNAEIQSVVRGIVTFTDNAFSGAVSFIELENDLSGEVVIKADYYASGDGDTTIIETAYLQANIPDIIRAGKVLYYDLDGLGVWDKDKLNTIARYDVERVFAAEPTLSMAVYEFSGAIVKVGKHIPDLDYICESENRLWGVSNRTHTIYASALGLPGVFSEFDVVSTDSYAVAVASEDDFTAICAYGGGVCCFKENRLHKILGSFPAQYYMNEYEIAGVQKGSERSLQIIDEVLYYKGKYGVYAYSGGVPRLVSYELGNIESAAKASVADGLNYYISLNDGVYVYDKLHGLWMRPWEISPQQMVLVGENIISMSEGEMYSDSGDIKNARWRAELTDFDGGVNRKRSYCKMELLLKMKEGSSLQVSVMTDRKKHRQIYSKSFIRDMTVELPLPPLKCNSMTVIIEGKGEGTLYGVTYEFTE